MNEEEIKQKLTLLEQKIDAVYVSAEKTRKYFLVVIIVSVVTLVVPLIGLAFAIPTFLKTINSIGSF